MNIVKPNNGVETKSGIFLEDIFKSVINFHWSQNAKIFQRLLQLDLSTSLQT